LPLATFFENSVDKNFNHSIVFSLMSKGTFSKKPKYLFFNLLRYVWSYSFVGSMIVANETVSSKTQLPKVILLQPSSISEFLINVETSVDPTIRSYFI